jgi:hypothetical protein
LTEIQPQRQALQRNNMRIAFNIGLVVSLLYLPWWVGALLAIYACFKVDKFYEVVIYGIFADALYGNRFGFYGIPYAATLYTVILLSISVTVRKRLSW